MKKLMLLAVLTVASLLVAPLVGPSLDTAEGAFILWQLRVPRALVGALVGASLGLVGAAYQTVFENPLATPSTTGTTAGASLGALAVLVLWPAAATTLVPAVAVGAFLGALSVTLAVTAMAARRAARIDDVLLAGIALTLAAGALTTGLQVQADMASTFRAVRWSLGSLAQVGYGGVLALLPFVLPAAAAILWQTPALEALVAGEDAAHARGVDVPRVRTTVLGAGALAVAACVAWCGPIAFVGLIVPHLVRRTVGATRRVLLPGSALAGASFLVLADALARVLIPGRDLPVGVLTAGLGAPLLVLLVARRR